MWDQDGAPHHRISHIVRNLANCDSHNFDGPFVNNMGSPMVGERYLVRYMYMYIVMFQIIF